MKKNYALSLMLPLVLAVAFMSCKSNFKGNSISGNGKIVMQEINIADYDAISIGGSGYVIYSQDSINNVFLSVEVDSNLLEHQDICVRNNVLHISSKDGYSLNPTKYVIRTNSKTLKNVKISGSGKVIAEGKVTTESISFSIAGSGDVLFLDLDAQSTEAQIAGSGDLTLKGTSTNASYKIVGSGKVSAKEFVQDTVKCSVTGSGDIFVHAKEKLFISIAGSGNIEYVGNPSIDQKVAGSGKVRKVEQTSIF